MATYPIPECLEDTHDGDEWAVAAILCGRVVALRYISDIVPDMKLTELAISHRLDGNPIELRELQALGPGSIGIVTIDGFEERWKLAES